MKQKIFTSLLLAVTIYATAFAQPVIGKQRTIGGNSDDQLFDMYLTKDGGLVAGGNSFSGISFEKTDSSRGYDDYWVIKLDSFGNIQWDKTIGGNSRDAMSSLQQTNDGGYILGGISESDISGEKTENARGGSDYWVVKLDSTGNIQWDKTIGGSDYDEFSSLQQTNDGGYILGGSSASNISGEKTENSRGGVDYWVVKLDSFGNIQWDKTIGGSDGDYFNSLQQTTDWGYILGGFSPSNISGEKTENNRGSFGHDYWIVKLDNFGNIQWDKTIGGSNNDQFSDLQQTTDGGYILGGYSGSNISGEKTQRSRGGSDYWVVKLDNSGNIQWDKTIGGSSPDNLQSLQQTSDGGYILGGESLSNISGEKTENNWGSFSFDYWVVKLDALGNFQGDKTIGGIESDYFISIKEIEKYHYVLGGFSYSGKSGDKTQWNRGGNNKTWDYWFVELKYLRPDSIAVATLQNASNLKSADNSGVDQFVVYPNPAKDILHIQANGTATFILTDQSGKVLLTKTIANKGEIKVANLAAGLYYLKNNESGVVQKVVISK